MVHWRCVVSNTNRFMGNDFVTYLLQNTLHPRGFASQPLVKSYLRQSLLRKVAESIGIQMKGLASLPLEIYWKKF